MFREFSKRRNEELLLGKAEPNAKIHGTLAR
jgi:hypothetical protein